MGYVSCCSLPLVGLCLPLPLILGLRADGLTWTGREHECANQAGERQQAVGRLWQRWAWPSLDNDAGF